jgi:hypothetical protein
MNSLLQLVLKSYSYLPDVDLLVLVFGLVSRFRLVEVRPNSEDIMDYRASSVDIFGHICNVRS